MQTLVVKLICIIALITGHRFSRFHQIYCFYLGQNVMNFNRTLGLGEHGNILSVYLMYCVKHVGQGVTLTRYILLPFYRENVKKCIVFCKVASCSVRFCKVVVGGKCGYIIYLFDVLSSTMFYKLSSNILLVSSLKLHVHL